MPLNLEQLEAYLVEEGKRHPRKGRRERGDFIHDFGGIGIGHGVAHGFTDGAGHPPLTHA